MSDASCDSDQPGHAVAIGGGAVIEPANLDAACARDRRLGMATWLSLRYGVGGPGDERGH